MISVSAAIGLSIALGTAPSPSGAEVIRSMHAKYNKTWYRQLSFVQRAIFADGRPEEEWWEAMKVPGRLRIDIAPVDSAPRTIIYRGDSLYVFTKGQPGKPARSPNLLLVLGFDVYLQPPETTIGLLEHEGFDLSKSHEDTWEGRPAYVIGAAQGDLDSKQVWIDKERLVFLRLLEKRPNGAADIRFSKYEKLGGGWIGTEVHFFTGGKETFTEIYRDWKINPAITDELFQVDQWKRPGWVTGK
jgi:outer membrane lipoprotein-sorting protein